MKMKSLLLLPGTLALMLAASPVIPAFISPAAAAPAHAGRWEQLNLTDAQKAQIKQINQSARQQIRAVYTSDQLAQLQQARQQHQKPNLNLSDSQKAQIRTIRQNAESQIEGLLSSEQQQQLQQLRQQRQQRYQQQ